MCGAPAAEMELQYRVLTTAELEDPPPSSSTPLSDEGEWRWHRWMCGAPTEVELRYRALTTAEVEDPSRRATSQQHLPHGYAGGDDLPGDDASHVWGANTHPLPFRTVRAQTPEGCRARADNTEGGGSIGCRDGADPARHLCMRWRGR